MKRKTSKFFAALISVIVAVSVLTVTVFAADTKGLSSGLKKYLSNPENTQFDFSDTSVVDNDADWTVFVLSRCGEKDVYPEYSEYINNAVKENYASLKPSDLARIMLSVKAYGLDPENIGGKDLISALKSVDYSSQTYMSSITYPLTALNFAEENISAEMLDTMLKTIIAGQQSDGGFPYCTVDTGYGISSDVDTTAMTVQALAKYYNTDERVKGSVNKALAYIKTQQFDDGSFGYVAWTSKSGESTSQVIIALCMLGIDPTGSEYSKADGNPVSALAQFVDSSTGAALDYSNQPNTLSSYQMLMALNSYERFKNGEVNIYTFEHASTPDPGSDKTSGTTSVTKTETAEATTVKTVDIPRTGSSNIILMSSAALMVLSGVIIASKKNNEEQ